MHAPHIAIAVAKGFTLLPRVGEVLCNVYIHRRIAFRRGDSHVPWNTRASHWSDGRGVRRVEEKGCREPIGLARSKDTVEWGNVAVVRPDLHHVSNVDRESTLVWAYSMPSSAVQHLKACWFIRVLPQQRDATRIRVLQRGTCVHVC